MYKVKDKSSVCDQILQSAREELLAKGILGLRVADVAAKSNTSITQIYRFFRHRDGLLARVLGDIYDEQTQVAVDVYLSHLPAERALTIRDLVDAIPVELTPELIKVQGLRNQILATSVHNNDLHDRLKVCSQRLLELWLVELDKLQDRMAPGEKFDRRFFIMVFAQQNPYYRTLINNNFFTAEEYREFLCEKLRLN
jgi:AcrR family transcriptional regulator